jgi:tRNA-uridine 2-sulfurtransferase
MGKSFPKDYNRRVKEINGSQKKTIIVALTGKLSSTVAAYLMKKQGYRVIGVSVQWFVGSEEQTLYSEWNLSQLTHVKAICDYLDIEFYGIQGHDHFVSHIEERSLSARLSGKLFDLNSAFHTQLLRLLIEKMHLLKAHKICTGHFAKITINQSSGRLNIITAADNENDQSYFLAGLTQHELSFLELPLAEINLKQVEKIASLFPFNLKPEPRKKLRFYELEKLYDNYFRTRVASSLIKSGQFYSVSTQEALGEHDGIHLIEIGSSHLHDKENHNLNSEAMAIAINPQSGQVYIDEIDELEYQIIAVSGLKLSEDVDSSKPFELFIRLPNQATKVKSLLHPMSNDNARIEITQKQRGFLPKGSYIALYSKASAGGKLLGIAEVVRAGFWDQDHFVMKNLPAEKEEEETFDEKELKDRAEKKAAVQSKGARF